MRILFHGHDFDLEDEKTRAEASNQYAQDLIHRICEDSPDPHIDIQTQLELLLTQLTDYWLQANATLAMAAATGSAGISLAQAQEMNAFIGSLIGQGVMDVLTPEQKAEAETLLRTGPQRIVLPD